MRCIEGDERSEMYKINTIYSLPNRFPDWFYKDAMEEARMELTNYKKNHCQLLVAKTKNMLKNVLQPTDLALAIETISYGSHYQIVAGELPNTLEVKSPPTKGLYLSGLMNESDIDEGSDFMHGCLVTASPDKAPCRRNSFSFISAENKSGSINYGEDLYIKISSQEGFPPLYLQAEYSTIDTFGAHLVTRLSAVPDVYCHFKIIHRHPRTRRAAMGSFVMPNTNVLIQNVASGRNLAAEISRWIPTFFGVECVVTCHTYQDQNKIETAENLWRIIGKKEADKGMMIRAAKGEDIPAELLE